MYLIHERTNYRLNAKEISEAVQLPKEFTSKILQVLAKHNVVNSRRGKGGGFKIAKSADAILLGELIDMFYDKHFLSKCLIGFKNDCIDCTCPMHNDWTKLKNQMYGSKISEIEGIKTFYSKIG